MTLDGGYVVSFFEIPGVTAKGVLPGPLTLPAVVDDLEWTEEADHNEYTTVAAGDFSQPAGGRFARKLAGGTLSVLCTSYVLPFAPGEDASTKRDPLEIESILRGVMRRRTPVQMFVDDTQLRSSASSAAEFAEYQLSAGSGGGCTFRSLVRTRRGGNPAALWLSLGVKEWRNQSASLTAGTVGFNGRALPTTYLSREGDNLGRVALDFYGSYSYWTTLARANKLTRVFQGTPLGVGTRLTVPERPAQAGAPKGSSGTGKQVLLPGVTVVPG